MGLHKNSKSAKIRELLAAGESVADIAKKLACSASLAYSVKASMGSAKKRGPGRPPKVATPVAAPVAALGALDSFVESMRNNESERARLLAMLQKIAAIAAEVL